jgi:hypothetical protein
MKDKTTVVISVGIAAFIAALAARYYLSSVPARETFWQNEIGAPATGGGDGAYEGIDISNCGSWSQVTAPTNPLKPYEAADDNQLFEFQNSVFKPECCPSSITADTGCICLTESEEKKLAYRGGNRVEE